MDVVDAGEEDERHAAADDEEDEGAVADGEAEILDEDYGEGFGEEVDEADLRKIVSTLPKSDRAA